MSGRSPPDRIARGSPWCTIAWARSKPPPGDRWSSRRGWNTGGQVTAASRLAGHGLRRRGAPAARPRRRKPEGACAAGPRGARSTSPAACGPARGRMPRRSIRGSRARRRAGRRGNGPPRRPGRRAGPRQLAGLEVRPVPLRGEFEAALCVTGRPRPGPPWRRGRRRGTRGRPASSGRQAGRLVEAPSIASLDALVGQVTEAAVGRLRARSDGASCGGGAIASSSIDLHARPA